VLPSVSLQPVNVPEVYAVHTKIFLELAVIILFTYVTMVMHLLCCDIKS